MPDGYHNICKKCNKEEKKKPKENILTYVRDIEEGRYIDGGKFALFRCACGMERIYPKYQVKINSIRSCGCLKNRDKRKPFSVERIPDEVRHLIKPDIGSFSLGNQHHRQWCSEVTCILCGFVKIQRNERVLYSLLHYGVPFVCQRCGGGPALKKHISDTIVALAKEDYMNSDVSWKELAEKYNVPQTILYARAGGKLLTQMRRLAKRKERISTMEKEFVEAAKLYIDKEKKVIEANQKNLEEWENQCNQN